MPVTSVRSWSRRIISLRPAWSIQQCLKRGGSDGGREEGRDGGKEGGREGKKIERWEGKEGGKGRKQERGREQKEGCVCVCGCGCARVQARVHVCVHSRLADAYVPLGTRGELGRENIES